MYCKSCGAENDDDAKFCVKCGVRVPSVRTSETSRVGENLESPSLQNQIAPRLTDPTTATGGFRENSQTSSYQSPESYRQPAVREDHTLNAYQLPRFVVPPS